MPDSTLYKEALMDHYRNPRNREDPRDASVVRRGSNPSCGDDLEVGVDFHGATLDRVRFHGRGCSVCIASASMMTEAVTGKTRGEVEGLYDGLRQWFDAGEEDAAPDPPASLRPLSALRQHPARRRCVLLAWEALADALNAN